MTKRVVVAVNDLMLAPRFLEAAKKLGYEAKRASSADSVEQACRGTERAVVLVDLHDARLRSAEIFGRLRDMANVASIGFYGHLMPELGEAAMAAGCTQTFSRGQLVGDLDAILQGAFL